MNHVYRWATTRYGPLADRLQGRMNEQCRVITRGVREWPTPTHAPRESAEVRAGLLQPWQAAYEAVKRG